MRCAPLPSTVEIHDQESQIIEHVDCCEVLVELDGIEKLWRTAPQYDVAEMHVTVTAADETGCGAAFEQWCRLLEVHDGQLMQPAAAIAGASVIACAGCDALPDAVDDLAHVRGVTRERAHRRRIVGPQHHCSEGCGHLIIDAGSVGNL